MSGRGALVHRMGAGRWPGAAAVLLALALRVGSLTFQSLWRDEVDALRFATQPLSQLLSMFRDPAQNGPLFFLALRPWIAAAGRSEFALRFPAAAFGVLAVPVVYVLVRRLSGKPAALVTAFCMALAPYLVWYGQEAKMYSALTLFIPASLLALTECARLEGSHGKRGRRIVAWLALYLLTSLAFYIHLVAVLVVPVQIAWLLALLRGRPARRLRTTGLYVALLFLPYLPLLAWQPSFLLSAPQTGFPFVAFGRILQVLTVGFALGVRPVQNVLALLPAMLLLVAGAVLPFLPSQDRSRPAVDGEAPSGAMPKPRSLDTEPGRRGTALLLAWLVLPPVLLYLVTLRIPLFTDRYVIWIGPAFFALLAGGVVTLSRAWRPLGVITLVPVLALLLRGTMVQATTPIKSDFRSAAALVTAHFEPGDVLIYQIPYIRYTFTYYASATRNPEDPAWAGIDGPYTNDGTAEPVVAAWLERQVGQASPVWLVASEVALWDERGLTEAWLARRGRITLEQTYSLVTVRRYEFSPE